MKVINTNQQLADRTEPENKFLNSLVIDSIVYRLTQEEALRYIETRFKKISLPCYKKRKALALSEQSTHVWLNHFTRIGFVQHHKEQIEHIQRLEDDSMRQFFVETLKQGPNRNEDTILKLKQDIRDNVKLHQEKPKPRFIFSEKSSLIDTYESFAKNGFEIKFDFGTPYHFEKSFISEVDLSRGPILVTVQNISRTMAVDHSSPTHQRKEYMTYTVDCEAKNWKGNRIRYTHEFEGKWTEQTKEIHTTVNPQTGEHIQQYHKTAPRTCYTIEWDKKKAQDLLTNEKYFGEDTINITNKPEVRYTGIFPYGEPSMRTGFPMEDFLNLTYQALYDKARTTESPQLQGLKRKQNPYG